MNTPYSQAKKINMSVSGGISKIMKGATATTDGEAGAVGAPLAGQQYLFWRGKRYRRADSRGYMGGGAR